MKVTKAELIALIDASSLESEDIITSITMTEKHVTVKGLSYDNNGCAFEVTNIVPIKNVETIDLG